MGAVAKIRTPLRVNNSHLIVSLLPRKRADFKRGEGGFTSLIPDFSPASPARRTMEYCAC